MKFTVKVVLIAAALAATGAYAKGDRTDANAIARAQTMGGIAGAKLALQPLPRSHRTAVPGEYHRQRARRRIDRRPTLDESNIAPP